VTRVKLGRLAVTALLVAPLLVAVGFSPGRWYAAALGWFGVALIAGATLTAHSLRSHLEDEIAGERSLAVVLGEVWTRRLYLGLAATAYLVLLGLLPVAPWTALALVTALLLGYPGWQVSSGAVSGHLDSVVRDTALVAVYYGALVGLGLVLSRV